VTDEKCCKFVALSAFILILRMVMEPDIDTV